MFRCPDGVLLGFDQVAEINFEIAIRLCSRMPRFSARPPW